MSKIIPRLFANIKDGKIIPNNLKVFKNYLTQLEGKEVQIKIEKRRSIRSLQQNKYYWGVVVELIAEDLGYTPQEAHDALRLEFLKVQDGKLPTVKSTTTLDKEEFVEYIEKIKVYAAQELNISIPNPEELWVD